MPQVISLWQSFREAMCSVSWPPWAVHSMFTMPSVIFGVSQMHLCSKKKKKTNCSYQVGTERFFFFFLQRHETSPKKNQAGERALNAPERKGPIYFCFFITQTWKDCSSRAPQLHLLNAGSRSGNSRTSQSIWVILLPILKEYMWVKAGSEQSKMGESTKMILNVFSEDVDKRLHCLPYKPEMFWHQAAGVPCSLKKKYIWF